MKKVRIIPPIPKEYKKLKVVAYCRVSNFRPAQMRSLEIQIKTYKKMIRSHPDWIYAGVFYDVESGLRRNGRTELDKMLKKAAKGEVDYIITKSISRVSRDTLEILQIVRFLRERGINMHFENEKLDSIDADKEFEITLRGMLAQDESRNTSENVQWGFQRKFEKDDIFTKYKNFMGYTCVDGEIVIVPEQAEVVRKIFDLYLQGGTINSTTFYDVLTDFKLIDEAESKTKNYFMIIIFENFKVNGKNIKEQLDDYIIWMMKARFNISKIILKNEMGITATVVGETLSMIM